MWKSLTILPLLLAGLTSGCSIYQSDGRKILEKNLATIGVTVQANFQGCDRLPTHREWTLLERREDSSVYSLDEDGYVLRVVPTTDETFNCYYGFNSAQEMFEKVSAACAKTVFELENPTPKQPDDTP